MALTPEQFNKIALKDDLKKFVTKDHFDEKMNEVMDKLDGIAKAFKDHGTEHVSNLAAHDRFERRITKLEECTVTKIAGK